MFKQVITIGLLIFPLMGFAQAMSPTVADAQKQVEAKCVNGCLVLSPDEIAAIEASIQEAVQKAYKAGLRGWSTVASR